MEIWIAIIALVVAAWQLYLQRREISRATRLEKLKIAADIVRAEIELREKIIADEKGKPNKNWDGRIRPHVDKVNKTLRPALRAIELKIIATCGGEISELVDLPSHLLQSTADSVPPVEAAAR